MIVRHTIIIAACVLGWSALQAQQPQNESLRDKIHKAWQKREESLKSVKFVWKEQLWRAKGVLSEFAKEGGITDPFAGQTVPPEDVTHSIDHQLWIKASNLKHETNPYEWSEKTKQFVQSRQISVCGDGFAKNLYVDSPGHNMIPRGHVHPQSYNPLRGLINYSALFISTRPIDRRFSGIDLEETKLIPERRTIDGRPCIGIERSANSRVWVDAEREYLPVLVESQFSPTMKRSLRIAYGQRDGIWLPSGWNWQEVKDQRTVESCRVTDVETTLDSIDTPAVFDLSFPNKTLVINSLTNDWHVETIFGRHHISASEGNIPYDAITKGIPFRVYAVFAVTGLILLCSLLVSLRIRRR
jgi:hypothetical protein